MKLTAAELEAALHALPLFPLPQVVLFPGALMPLHVFEPRYRQLVRDVLATHATFSVVQIPDEAQVDAHGHPAIARIASVGTIVDHVELPSGRFNILVRGRARVSLDELPFVSPYRRARAEILPSTHENVPPADIAALISAATSFATMVRERDADFELRLPREGDAGALADLCAAQLLLDGRDRQKALELLDVCERVRFVTENVALQRLALGGEVGGLN